MLLTIPDMVRRAQQMPGPSFKFPWRSFAEFFEARVGDPALQDRPFLLYYDDDCGVHRAYSYRAFGVEVRRTAAFLEQRCGLSRGDRLATVLFNHDRTVILYFAAWVLGVAVVPINVDETPERKRYILEHSEAAVACCRRDSLEEILALQRDLPLLRRCVVVTDEGWVEDENAEQDRMPAHRPSGAAANPAPPDLLDEALIVYTSGTTGPPKGVLLTAYNLLIDADAISRWHGFGRSDRLMCVLPIHHVNGTVVTLVTPFYAQAGTVLNRKFKTVSFWRRIHEEGVTCVSVVPTLLEYLLDADEDVTRYKLNHFGGVICGAGPLLKETALRFEERFRFPIRHGYGLSETTCYSCFLPNDLSTTAHRHWLAEYEFPSIGVPLPHNEMAILDAEGCTVPEMARGEICIRGRTVCSGYFKRPDANEAAFQWGWFRSGDEGFMANDERGRPFFFISGRLKELIIRGGVNISPLEIDDALKTHPAVKFAMAVPFDNRYYGEEIAAYIVAKDPAHLPTEAELHAHCRARLPFAKRPKVLLFGEEVPYTSTGKPKRLELKRRLAAPLTAYRDTQFRESS